MMNSFKGDFEMFHRCRLEARKKIIENSKEQDPIQVQNKIFFGEEVREFLDTNMIQGKLQENGNYRFKARPEQNKIS
jgi:complex III assembly factor LYRM7